MTRWMLKCVFAIVVSVSAWGISGQGVHADTLPAPNYDIVLPPPASNSFNSMTTFGPQDGLLYVWTGARLLRQDAPFSNSFTSLGTVGSGSADAGPIAFSHDGSQLLLGNGTGGMQGGAHAGQIFSVPASGGNSNTPVGNVMYQHSFLAAPLGNPSSTYFVNQGNASFSGSNVSLFDSASGSTVSVIDNIPGASTSLTSDSSGRLYVGVGFGPQRGHLRRFSLHDLENAYNTATPLDWNDGELFNAVDNNSGAGMFFDSRGMLFVGGPNGVTVFDQNGKSTFYDNGGYSDVLYDPIHDFVLVTGWGEYQGAYPIANFQVPEPSSVVLAGIACLALVFCARRRK